MTETRINACLIIDDAPINASYWWRRQQTERGFSPPEIAYGQPWRSQADAAMMSIALFEAIADFAEAFDVRGKMTLLPRPAGLGRVDQSVQGFTRAQLDAILDIYRSRLAARFDITPEVLTHTLAIDTATGELLPHSETAWVSALARDGKMDELIRYFTDAYVILQNAGLEPHGTTVGGMNDPSGIAGDEMIIHGHHLECLSQALWAVERDTSTRQSPPPDMTFMHVGTGPRTPRGHDAGLPERVTDFSDGGHAWSITMNSPDDPLAPLFGGTGDVDAVTDAMVGPGLDSGWWIDEAEAGRAIVVNVHGQTLGSRNTHLGLKALTEAVRRLTERYGDRLCWCTTRELCRRPDPSAAGA